MKNFKIQPFEKNNYFYGKLLTVRDFQSEQKYNDGKRWMLNRFMFGSGIAAGLRAVMIDEHTVSLEPGIAIDKLGREIVVASPVTQKLSLMDGFNNTGYSKAVYMCIDYEERGNERIQAVTNAEEGSDELSSYNRIREGFRLYLRESIPEEDENRTSSLIENRMCVINSAKMKAYVTIPKYVCPGEEFELTLEVVKKDMVSRCEFSLNIKTTSSYDPSNRLSSAFVMDFSEPENSISSYYRIRRSLKAGVVPEKNAYFEISPGMVRIDGKIQPSDNSILSYRVVNDKNAAVLHDYRSKSLDDVCEEDYDTIYLAKIELLKVESTYLIRSITECPFGQYIKSVRLTGSLTSGSQNRGIVSVKSEAKKSPYVDTPEVDAETDENGSVKFSFTFPEGEGKSADLSSGEVVFDIEELIDAPKVFYSKETDHGLGKGEIFISLAIAGDDNVQDAIICGDQSILTAGGARAAALIYPEKGTFRVALKLDFAYVGRRVKVKWGAVRHQPVC